jgi:hypothetical protein
VALQVSKIATVVPPPVPQQAQLAFEEVGDNSGVVQVPWQYQSNTCSQRAEHTVLDAYALIWVCASVWATPACRVGLVLDTMQYDVLQVMLAPGCVRKHAPVVKHSIPNTCLFNNRVKLEL